MVSRVGNAGWIAANYISDTSGHDVAIPQVSISDITGTVLGTVGNPLVVTNSGGAGTTNVQGTQANGAATTANPVLVGGYDGTNTRNLRTDTTGNLSVGGNVANASGDGGNPVKIGGYASGPVPTVVAAGQRVNAWYSINGAAVIAGIASTGSDTGSNTLVQVTTSAGSNAKLDVALSGFDGTQWVRTRGDVNATAVQPALTASFWNYAAATGGIANSTTAVTVKAAAGAGVRNYIEAIDLSWDNLTTATEFAIRDGAAGTVLWRRKIPSGSAGGQFVKFGTPLKGTANTLVEIVTLTASGSGAVFANLQGWTGS